MGQAIHPQEEKKLSYGCIWLSHRPRSRLQQLLLQKELGWGSFPRLWRSLPASSSGTSAPSPQPWHAPAPRHHRAQRKVSFAEGAGEEGHKRSVRLSAKRAPAKVEMKPQKAAGKDHFRPPTKVQTKGKRGAKGKQAEVAY